MESKFIVTTTIHEPTVALKKFASLKDWKLIVVGDKKTPHEAYKEFNCVYLSPDYQQETYPELSEAIGWNCIMRRNLGFLEAYKLGATVVATVDDDNIPYDNWGRFLRVNETITVDEYENETGLIFDPLQMTNHPELWHRGFPLSCIKGSKTIHYRGMKEVEVLIQADLWDGDPDVDAICRMIHQPFGLKLELSAPFVARECVPFNSQNTFISRKILPYYMCLPHVGRMDDIWGGYLAQWMYPTQPLFMPATVFQARNGQSIEKNFKDEVEGHLKTIDLISETWRWSTILPDAAVKAFVEYRKAYESINS